MFFWRFFGGFGPLSCSNQRRYGGVPHLCFDPLGVGYPKHQLSSKSETLQKNRLFWGCFFGVFSGVLDRSPARTRGDTGVCLIYVLIPLVWAIQNTNYLPNRRHFKKIDYFGDVFLAFFRGFWTALLLEPEEIRGCASFMF